MSKFISVLFVFLSCNAFAIDHALIKKALKGDNDAKFQIAIQLIEPKGEFYSPDKAQEMLLSLAKLGDTRAFSPLSRIFADPNIKEYSPRRSLFYLTKVEGDTSVREALYSVLSGKSEPNSLRNLPISTSSALRGIVSTMTMYPFKKLSQQNIDDLREYFKHSSVAPYEAYIYPAIITPVVANTHLYGVDSLTLNENWSFDSYSGKYVPIRDSKGVLSVEIKNDDIKKVTLYYDTENYLPIVDYYAAFLPSTQIRNGFVFDAPGVQVIVSRTYDSASVVFSYKKLRPLIQSSKNK